jgi:urea transport system ATP-binding protein
VERKPEPDAAVAAPLTVGLAGPADPVAAPADAAPTPEDGGPAFADGARAIADDARASADASATPSGSGLASADASRSPVEPSPAPAPFGDGWIPKAQRRKLYVLLLEEITVSFDGFRALDGLSLYLREGELRSVIGPNGAGKTTMMDVITGSTRPDSGEAWYSETVNLLEKDEVYIAQAGVCRKFQKPSVFETLTVHQNLELALKAPKTVWSTFRARLSGEERDFIGQTLELTRLSNEAARPAGALSHGQKQWLEIGMLLAQKPRVLLLDEPVAGMTPQEIDRTVTLLKSLEGRCSIVLVEHDMEFVRAVASRVTVLHQGRVLSEGTMDEVSADPEVIEAYLGGAAC